MKKPKEERGERDEENKKGKGKEKTSSSSSESESNREEGKENGADNGGRRKYCAAPICLFYYNDQKNTFYPIAIQLQQQKRLIFLTPLYSL